MKRKFLTCCGVLISAYSDRPIRSVVGFITTPVGRRKISILYPLSKLQGRVVLVKFPCLDFQRQSLLQLPSFKLSSTAAEQSTLAPDSTMGRTVKLLAKAWTPQLMEIEHGNEKSDKAHRKACEAAVQRTLPLFLQVKDNETFCDDSAAASVPFVCRYRTDIIHPLSTQQVHELRSMVGQHDSLRNLRNKLLPHFPPQGDDKSEESVTTIRAKIMASTSKSELEDLYAPFKPPPKGSVYERLQSEHPELVDSIEALWKEKDCNKPGCVKKWLKVAPREAVVQVLGTKIASEPQITWWMMESLKSHCRVKTTIVAEKKTDEKPKSKKTNSKSTATQTNKYSEAYGDFSARVMYLKDHQVLAIRRGVQEKALKMSFDIDSGKTEGNLLWRLRKNNNSNESDQSSSNNLVIPTVLLSYSNDSLKKEAMHDAWSRLLRRRGTTRLWADKCKEAQNRACQVFEDNLQRALLAPPYHIPARPLLAMDPGFAAGIKCALLDSDGGVLRLDTVRFLGSEKTRKAAVAKLEGMLQEIQSFGNSLGVKEVTIALGNGHGSKDSRELILAASTNSGIPIDMQVVSEAGASVWSVTKNAQTEFPDQPPAAVASISIGRRLQNPLFELVKVPPKSLGLGMYQHDLSEKELDEKLQLTSVDAVAMVGVDVNSGSLEILQKVPGLSASLSKKIIKARPLKQRKDLLKISGLGPKSYENCAGFVRIANGPEPLDDTLVHPESYDLARWLLKEFSWELDHSGKGSTIQENRNEWKADWEDSVNKAAMKYSVSRERVLAVLENLVDSASKLDPRLKLLESDATNPSSGSASSSHGLVASCKALPAELSEIHRMSEVIGQQGRPIRGIVGTILNVADFGAFVDIGNEKNGLLHVSKLGPNLRLQDLLIGQQIGVDILSVNSENSRISLGLHGCNLQARTPRNSGPRSRIDGSSKSRGRSGGKRTISTSVGSSKNSSGGSKKKRRLQK